MVHVLDAYHKPSLERSEELPVSALARTREETKNTYVERITVKTVSALAQGI